MPACSQPPKPKLTYTVAPALIAVGGTAKLTVTVSNASQKDINCKQITLRLAIGENADSFTTKEDAKNIGTSKPQKWRADTTQREKGTFTFSPQSNAGKPHIKQGGSLPSITLYDIKVNSSPGNALLTIEEELDDGSAKAQDIRRVAKFSGGFSLSDFRCERPEVEAGAKARLSWDVKNRTDEKIVLYHPGAPSGIDVSTTQQYALPIHRDTAFTIRATQHKTGQNEVTHALSSFVTCTNQHLEVNKLQTRDAVTLLHRPRTDPGFLPPHETGTHQRTYRATTDGVLIGAFRTHRPDVSGSLTITVEPPDTSAGAHTARLYDAGAGSGNPHDPGPELALPVPEGHTVTVQWILNIGTTDDTTTPFTTLLHWHPWGNGHLASATSP
ncbi:hypothetical protein ACF06Q_26125 [Streptomyces leeuwenhoekii]|uniref:hypothetical protein n=1 Tax=Streptomyces leeuwenhoekii TaxID=1437453 RepID=UPI0036F63389